MLADLMCIDLTVPFQILCMICGLLVLHVMQQTWNDKMSQHDPVAMQWGRRSAYIALTLGLAWSASYVDSHQQSASPPLFLMVFAMTVVFFIRAVLLHRHRNDHSGAAASSRITQH